MKERDFQVLFKGWLRDNWHYESAAFELKIEKGPSLRFDKLAQHQEDYLTWAKHNKVYWKISDTGMIQKPFDCFVLVKVKAYIVIWFYKPRTEKIMYWLDIDHFKKLRDDFIKAGRKSIKRSEVEHVADKTFRFDIKKDIADDNNNISGSRPARCAKSVSGKRKRRTRKAKK